MSKASSFPMPPEIYSWLVYLKVIENLNQSPQLSSLLNNINVDNNKDNNLVDLQTSIANFTFNEDGSICLPDKISYSIYTGDLFPKIFSKMNLLMNQIYGNIYKDDETLSNVINDNNPSVKLQNFNIILETMKNYYGLIFEDNFKTLLVAGDNASFLELFKRLFSFYEELKKKIEKDKEIVYEKENKQNLEQLLFEDEQKEVPKIRFNEDIVDLERLEDLGNDLKPLNQTKNVLEFLIIALCKTLSLNPKQTASLLNDNKKYLGYILKNGIAEKNFTPVKLFYQEVLTNLDYLLNLIQINSIVFPNQISKNIFFTLNCVKFGLVSKNFEVVSLAGRLLSNLALKLIEKNLISAAWDWFISPSGGMEFCYLSNNKNIDSAEIIVGVINNFTRFHFVEFFTIYLKNYINNDENYLDFMSDLLCPLSKLSNFNEDFQRSLKKFFMEIALQSSRSANKNEKAKACIFTGELWRNFSLYFDTAMENYQMLSILKSMVKDSFHLIQIMAIIQLFKTLISFSSERNKFVSIIYKSLIFTFIEYHAELHIREIMLSNFTHLFKTILSIPVGIMTTPYVREISIAMDTTYQFNMNDITFINIVSKHPRLNIKDAILILDVLGKVFTNIGNDETQESIPNAMRTNLYRGIYFYKIIISLFTMLLSRYMVHEIGVEFIFKFCKFLIQTFCALDKGLSDKIFLNALVLNVNPENEKEKLVFEEDIILNENEKNKTINYRNIMKIAIVSMVLNILQINNTFVNGIVKNLIITAELRHYQIYNFHNIGLSKMLSHFGKYHDLIYYYNVNKDELDVDKDHEIAISLIFDKIPELKEDEAILIERRKQAMLKQNEMNKNESLKSTLKREEPILSKTDVRLMDSEKVSQMRALKKSMDNYREEQKNKNSVPFHERYRLSNEKGSFEDQNFKKLENNINILDLNCEEDRDLLELQILTKNYQSFFKEIFTKYCGSVYHPVKGKSFNSIKEISDNISTTEIIKLFKEHNVVDRLITRDELVLLITLMNTKIFKKISLKSGILYNEFIEDFVQVSYFCFTRPPFIYRNYTIANFTEEMIKYFQREFPENLLYLNPIELLSDYQRNVCNAINDKLKKSNFVPVPKGFTKFLDTEIYMKYYVPEEMYFLLGESTTICLELLDEIFYISLGVHILEGFAKFVQNYKIRPINSQKLLPKSDQRDMFAQEKLKILKERKNKSYYLLKQKEPSNIFPEAKSKNIKEALRKKDNKNYK